MKKSVDNKMMLYSNYSTSSPFNAYNGINDRMINPLTGWSEVVPQSMPWATTHTTLPAIQTNNSNMNELNRSVMQFTAYSDVINSDQSLDVLSPDPCTSQTATRWELLNNISTRSSSSNQHLKRRNDSSDDELEDGLKRPIKQYISEDKVSAIFNRMHITNDLSENKFECDQEFECNENEEDQLNKGRQIVLTDELQNAINAQDVTQKFIQNELDKQSKAVVLWQPTNPIIPFLIKSKCREDDEQEEESGSSNEDSTKTTAVNSDYLDIDFVPIDETTENDSQMELCP